MRGDLTRAAVYERCVRASLERVWENVRDWEHLPWLHAGSFSSIVLVGRGEWGWRARIGTRPHGREILLELVIDGDRYVSRTLEGPGAGSEIWTQLSRRSDHETDIRVEFLLPGVSPAVAETLGGALTALYTRLWDEDEAMMQRRESLLSARAPAPAEAGALDLGPAAEVRARAPLTVELAGRAYRVVRLADDTLVAHATICPHWLGPLDSSEVEDGCVTCPWHGYRFDLRTGRRPGVQSPLRLLLARVSIDPETGGARLTATGDPRLEGQDLVARSTRPR
jgi:nitrite reductase/ring-hydroxylating ferredoxin subunit